MKRILCSLMLAAFVAVPLVPSKARASNNPELKMLKSQQKAERKALDQKHHFQKMAMKGQDISPAVRAQIKHQMQRESRDLAQKQKDQMQDFKDRMRLYNESMRQYGQ